jgi:hypothetical protein
LRFFAALSMTVPILVVKPHYQHEYDQSAPTKYYRCWFLKVMAYDSPCFAWCSIPVR